MSPAAIPPRVLADRLVLALVEDGCTLRSYHESNAVLERGRSTFIVLSQPHALQRLPDLGQVGNAEIVVLGGPPAVGEQLQQARPRVTKGRVHLFHVDDDDASGADGTERTTALGMLLRRRHELPEVDPLQLTSLVEQAQAQQQVRVEQAKQFQHVLGDRRPLATYALLAVIGVCFGLEMLWGGSESMPTLVSMGALVRERAFEQPWRLLSCTFLHAGLLHLAFNAYVLYALGSSLERILGHERFLVLYVASAVGGSLASTVVLGEGVSVGASGAIWGLLAAEGVLALRPAGLLPDAVIPGLKRAALINLGLNIVNSFRPEVDWAAHAGGGVVGGLLVLAGVLTVGLPRLAELGQDARPHDRRPAWLRPTAVVLTSVLVGGGIYGIVRDAPWAPMQAPPLARRPLGTGGLSLELPSTLGDPVELQEQPDQLTAVYGDLVRDLMVVEVVVLRYERPLTDEERDAEFQDLESGLSKGVPEGAQRVEPPRARLDGDVRLTTSAYGFEGGVVVERVGFVSPTLAGRVDFGMWPRLRAAGYEGVAERVARSLWSGP
ncbi:MAG: rhomboid family intramembrane serine protease [Nannocystaceae bacterium]